MFRGQDGVGWAPQPPVKDWDVGIDGMRPRSAVTSPHHIPQVDFANATRQEQREGSKGLCEGSILIQVLLCTGDSVPAQALIQHLGKPVLGGRHQIARTCPFQLVGYRATKAARCRFFRPRSGWRGVAARQVCAALNLTRLHRDRDQRIFELRSQHPELQRLPQATRLRQHPADQGIAKPGLP